MTQRMLSIDNFTNGIIVLISALFLFSISVPVLSSDLVLISSKADSIQSDKILVVYYSRTGKTKGLAHEIASKMNAAIEEILDNKDRSGLKGLESCDEDARNKTMENLAEMKKNPKNYNLVLIGTPIWNGTVSTPVRTFLIKYKDSLPDRIAFFTTGRFTKADPVVKDMEELLGKSSIASVGFRSFMGDLFRYKKEKKIRIFVNSIKCQDTTN
jgi:menaquinone-dependent protoporphyrinogen IX oxidase